MNPKSKEKHQRPFTQVGLSTNGQASKRKILNLTNYVNQELRWRPLAFLYQQNTHDTLNDLRHFHLPLKQYMEKIIIELV